MPEHKIGTREEWQAARAELATLEAEHAERNEELQKKRQELPWVPVEKEYEFDTEDGKRSLADLFDGRPQLLAYNIMFGPDFQVGACLKEGLRENPGFIAFAQENGTVYHTYTVTAPEPFVAPYHSFLLDRTPKGWPSPRVWRKDEYPD